MALANSILVFHRSGLRVRLHSAPKRFDHGVVIAITDRSHRRDQSGDVCPAGECPRCELHSVVGMNQSTGRWASIRNGHSQGVCHQCRSLRTVDRPTDDLPRKRIQDNSAVDFSFARGMFRDIGDPQRVRLVAGEFTVDEIGCGRGLMLGTATSLSQNSFHTSCSHQ